jgi:hypothetical protein
MKKHWLILLIAALLAVYVIDKYGRSDSDEIYLLTHFGYKEYDHYQIEYDSLNRVSKYWKYNGDEVEKIAEWTYDDANNVIKEVEMFPKNDSIYIQTFDLQGNKKFSTWHISEDSIKIDSIYMNKDLMYESGFRIFVHDAHSYDSVHAKYECQDKNLIRHVWYKAEFRDGKKTEQKSIVNLSYDDKKSPFIYCKTPQWALCNAFGFDIGPSQNNPVIIDYANNIKYNLIYEYNRKGLPEKRTYQWYDNVQEQDVEASFSYTYIKKKIPKQDNNK